MSLGEEHRLRVFENRVLSLFGPKREEVAGGWRRLHNEQLHDLYTSPNVIIIFGDQIKEDEMGGGCSTHGREVN
jgi:hypothetical protein